MTRYVIKKNNEWAVVNANYKRSIKLFKTQQTAIKFAKELLDTTNIVVQGSDHKFRKLSNWDLKDEGRIVKYVPRYVFKNINEELYKARTKNAVLWGLFAAFTAMAIIFFIMFGVERIQNA